MQDRHQLPRGGTASLIRWPVRGGGLGLLVAAVMLTAAPRTGHGFDNDQFLTACQAECRGVAEICDTYAVDDVVAGEPLYEPNGAQAGAIDLARLSSTRSFLTCLMRGPGFVALPANSGHVLWTDGWGVILATDCVEVLQLAENTGSTMAGGMFAGGGRCD